MGLLYIFGSLLVFITLGIAYSQLRLRRLRFHRSGNNFGRENFIAAFRPVKIPDEVPAAVYDYYSSQKAWKNFPFSPNDKYSEVLCDDPWDIMDDQRALTNRLGLLFPPEYIQREYAGNPIETLRDMVLWLDWTRQHQPTGACQPTESS